jgi:hypothetical protein
MTDKMKLGALAPRRPFGLSTLAVYAEGKLPAPPANVAVPHVAHWGMMDNDRLGCCTVSGAGHAIIAWNTEVHENDHVPTDAEVQSTYFSLTGGADAGCVEADVLDTWHKNGLFGHKIAGYAPVETHDFVGLQQAIAFYGAAYLGVALPESAQEQFQTGAAWTVVPGSPIEGGHCILAVGYSHEYVQCVTWGGIVNVSYPWLANYLTEVWAIIPNEFVEAGRGPSIDLNTLKADLAAISH